MTVDTGMNPHRVALVPGSLRADSLNRRLAHDLTARFRAGGVDAELIDLADHPLPIYHGDDELAHGVPAEARRLHDRLASMHGVVFVSPEYNGGLPAVLKNSIDWVSRVDRAVFRTWLVGLAATSPGPRGAIDVLAAMRHIGAHMRWELLPTHLSVPRGGEAFDEADPTRLARPDVVDAASAFVDEYIAALDEWVATGRGLVA